MREMGFGPVADKKTTLPELGTQEKNPQNLNPINPAGLIN
jgi:hypothetical protein